MNIEWQLLEAGHCVHPECSTRSGGSWRPQVYPAFVGLLRHPDHGWLLFDTGYGQAFVDATRGLPEALYRWTAPVHWTPAQGVRSQIEARGLSADEIRHVLVSHFHGDHVGALPDFPSAKVWCSRDAWIDLHSRSRMGALFKGLLPDLAPRSLSSRLGFFENQMACALPEELAPFVSGYDVFEDHSVLAVSLPGHAAGHMGICFSTARGRVFMIGDAAWSVKAVTLNAPPPKLITGLLGDTVAYRLTLCNLHALATRNPGLVLVPSHCQSLRS